MKTKTTLTMPSHQHANRLFVRSLSVVMILLVLVSCADDDFTVIESEITMESEEDFMSLSRIGCEYQVDIQTESDATWKATIDGVLGYVSNEDTQGTGSKSITFYTSTNRYDEDRTANLCITFPGHEESNITIPMKQLGLFSDPTNADELSTGNQIYAVGFGYDTRDKWANPSSIKAEILRTSELIKSGIISAGSVEYAMDADIVTGSSITELSNKLNTTANVSGGGWGFKGEVGGSFKMEDIQTNQYEYAIAYINVAKKSVTANKTAQTLAKRHNMTEEAYNEINGLNKDGIRSDADCAYPSTPQGFDKLLNGYGTHLVNKARLGGQVKYAMRMDIKDIEGSYDLNAFAKMSYDGVVKANASVTDDLKSSYKKNSSHIHTTVYVLGGSEDAAGAIADMNKTEELTKYFDEWKISLKDDKNLALVDFEASDALIPLYELVDKENYPQRYEDMKAYMKKARLDAIQAANNEYSSGITTMLQGLPAFDDSSEKNTMIKDVYNNGQWVGRICSEYIPAINKKERVTVIYPVISDNEKSYVKYNMGYFIGDSGHRPAKVCLNDSKITVTECADEAIGAKDTIYLKGTGVSGVTYENAIPATVEDATVAAPGENGTYNYPIVKIFDKIWMRENYRTAWNDEFGNSFYFITNFSDLTSSEIDGGWHIPAESDFKSIKETLSNYGVTEITTAKAFFTDAEGGVLGFHHIHAGRINLGKNLVEQKNECGYYTCWPTRVCRISKQEEFSFIDNYFLPSIFDTYAYPLRCVQYIEQ